MDEDHHNTAILWEIKGVLTEFKESTTRQFSEIKEIVSSANQNAADANNKADKALEYSRGIVFRSGFIGSMASFIVFGFVWAIEHASTIFNVVK